MHGRILFDVECVLGFRVRTTTSYWEIIQRKHPEIKGRLEEIIETLLRPTLIRRSSQDPLVYLFYSKYPPYYHVVVVKQAGEYGFMITSYLTDRIKEGEALWPD